MEILILLSILNGDLPLRPTYIADDTIRSVYAEIYCWEGSKSLENGVKSGKLKPVE